MARRTVPLAVFAILGIIAAGLGGYHGYGEIRQGNATPQGYFINAFGGADCPPEEDAMCFPAMTVLLFTNFMTIGILTVIIAIITVISVIIVLMRRDRGVGLFASSIALLLVGGGFFAPIIGIVGAIVGFIATRSK